MSENMPQEPQRRQIAAVAAARARDGARLTGGEILDIMLARIAVWRYKQKLNGNF
jgi:hypothetical protein